MMDASRMYPKGHHPLHESFLPSFEDWAPIIARSAAHVKYYFVDFGISSSFSPSDTEPKLVLGEDGIDQEVPELSDTVPYDPFKVDVFIMGNVFRRNFYDVSLDLTFVIVAFGPNGPVTGFLKRRVSQAIVRTYDTCRPFIKTYRRTGFGSLERNSPPDICCT